MAVITTYQNIIEGAYQKSLKNSPGTIAAESTELLELVVRSIRGLYAVAARINPYFFAEKSSAVAPAGGSWPYPEIAEALFKVEGNGTTGGTVDSGIEVKVVPFDQREIEAKKPAIYFYGQQFYPAGAATPNPDATIDELIFYYSKRPSDPTATTDTLDAMWPEQFNELLMLEVAIYLEMKRDESQTAQAELKSQRDDWARRFAAHLEHAVANEVRSYSHFRIINTSTLIPLGDLLAGGSNALGG